MTVPARYRGLWRREGIWRSDGSSDTTTLVLWFQSARWHIDSRGFAGSTVVDGARCEWRPEIAFPALGPGVDAGIMRFIDADTVEETGIDGSYRELWRRIDAGPVRALRLEDDRGARAWLMTGMDWLALAHGSEFVFARGAGDAWVVAATNLAQHAARTIAWPPRAWRIGEQVVLPLGAARPWRISQLEP
ncbi:hypothetical protein INH39_16400 [Massilia violaceinigra]|uniref:Uncharacterized protein n=1 Tax=Massilia violaceinigra TaxID=2045208 RepID=A0ABY4AHF8_9BURK|nr:hypothetical protein [Massilia violaceinigra]UOD33074.1 hypothetical protein INH39_16400 [Massilia violaceinigra]